MKIHVTTKDAAIDGYIWASPQNKELNSPFFKCWEFCMEAQCTELYAPNIMNHFSIEDLEKIVPIWTKLLCPGGKIIIGGLDIYILAKVITKRNKSLMQINKALFEEPIRSFSSANYTKNFLNSLGLKVYNIELNYDNFNYTVEGIK